MPRIANAEAEPEGEIEITPEMMSAGRRAVIEYDGRFESPQEAAVRIYRSMVLASPAAGAKDHDR